MLELKRAVVVNRKPIPVVEDITCTYYFNDFEEFLWLLLGISVCVVYYHIG